MGSGGTEVSGVPWDGQRAEQQGSCELGQSSHFPNLFLDYLY